MNNNLSKFTKFGDLFLASEENLPRNSQYGKLYHNSPSSAKCPRCQILGELLEDGPIRCLYRCRSCGVFVKLTPKKQLHGLTQSIAQGELTTALEILEIAGHKDQDAIDALNRYRGVSHA